MASTGALSRRAGATVQAAEPEPAPTPMPMPVTAPPSASVVSPTVEPLWTEDPAEDRPTAPPKPPPAKPRTDASSTPSGVFPAVKRFSEVEVAHGIAWSPLSGGDFIGDHCYCLPRDDLRAQRATTNLQCARCANVSVAAKTGACSGVDQSGRMRAGGYICASYPRPVAPARRDPGSVFE
jgi:hypothetical protein